jgi:hypothetical protein
VAVLSASALSFADDSPPSDKSGFTLFNPTPAADMREIDTDRPDKTNSPHTVDAGHLQIEFGLSDYTYNRDRYHGANARSDVVNAGEFNFRLGVLNHVELNAIVNPYVFDRETDYTTHQSTRQSSFGDTAVGGKINCWGDDGSDKVWDTALGIQAQFKIPTARKNVGNGHSELQIGLPLLINLPANLSLSLETAGNCERNSTDTGYVTGWDNSVSLDGTILGKLDGFIEYWSHVSSEGHQEAQQTLDVGLIYGFSDNLVIDTGVFLGLNHASPSVEWTLGGTIRF